MTLLRRLPQAPVTLALVAVNLAVFAVMVLTSKHLSLGAFEGEILVDAGASVAVPGWRWLTAAFVHVNLFHILMNMWVLAQIGVLSEKAIGRGLFLATYVVTGASGNLLGTFLQLARHSPIISAGASGAIMGLLGAAAVYAWRTGQRPIASALAKNVVFVLVVGFAASASGALAVDNAAHVGGLVIGAVIGLARAHWPQTAPVWADRLLLGLSTAATLAAFAFVLFLGA
jgi:rhomboid protease GluP